MATLADIKKCRQMFGNKLVDVIIRDGWLCAQIESFTKDGDRYFPVVQVRQISQNTSLDF